MNKLILVFIIGFLSFTGVDSQDSLFVYSPKHINGNRFFLNESGQFWKFKKGNNPEWSQPGFDDSDWDNYNPSSLVLDLTEESGRLEGWFRFQFTLSDSLKNEQLTFILDDYGQAIEVFLDGTKVHTHGQFPNDSLEFEGAKTKGVTALVPFMPTHDSVYTLAMHYLHMPVKSPFTQFVNDGTLRFSIGLVDLGFISRTNKNRMRNVALQLFVATIVVLIFVMFWFFWLLDRKNLLLLLIALCVSGFFLFTAGAVLRGKLFDMSMVNAYVLQNIPAILGTSLVLGTIPLIFAKIFRGAVSKYLYAIGPVVFLIVLADTYINIHGLNRSLTVYLPFVAVGLVFLFCSFLIVRTRKKIRGAQWAIITGLSLFLLFTIFMVTSATFFITYLSNIGLTGQLFLQYSWQIIFPLSLMAYTILRFRETQNEVRVNAEEVVRVTEEKRQQAVQQQEVLEQKVEQRTEELSNSLKELKATQAQLIQSEKMASLGELTAGIAHEIQNPLNFVNNFSDVSGELLDEVDEELQKGNAQGAREIVVDLKENLSKINHHGNRASVIVKGMLEHSRESSEEKVDVDINALCDEYLRLSYHGLRAKDKSFNANFETHFDKNLPKVKAIPQDIGRVLLNVFNNAFYAVHQRNQTGLEDQSGLVFTPKVEVTTEQVNGSVKIAIKDNGNGIPKKIRDKIFQPFFTTKPTGQGTGLGLSLSYDIVKSHGGDITIDSEMNKGSEFVISLPLDSPNPQ